MDNPLRPLLTLSERVQASRKDALTLAAVTLEGGIKEELSRPGTGRLYVVGRTQGRLRKNGTRGPSKPRLHRASAPGQPPAADSGVLRNSIHHEVNSESARVGTNVAYAQPLNNGTTTAGRSHNVTIAPRPFMQPGLERVRDKLRTVVVGPLRNAARGGK